jgi:hypothetical protein
VTVMWTADDLVSRARTTYPVAEVRTILTG